MATRHLESIAERLIRSGRRTDEPVAVISKATTPAQRVLVSTLSDLASVARAIETPSVVVIGEVVKLRATMDWVGALAASRPHPVTHRAA
jgi:uroporphyrin-III C-methyltransferase